MLGPGSGFVGLSLCDFRVRGPALLLVVCRRGAGRAASEGVARYFSEGASCVRCPENSRTDGEGSVSVEACVCIDGSRGLPTAIR